MVLSALAVAMVLAPLSGAVRAEAAGTVVSSTTSQLPNGTSTTFNTGAIGTYTVTFTSDPSPLVAGQDATFTATVYCDWWACYSSWLRVQGPSGVTVCAMTDGVDHSLTAGVVHTFTCSGKWPGGDAVLQWNNSGMEGYFPLKGTDSKTQWFPANDGGVGGSVGDYVWNDANANGVQDAGEKGIGGVLVQLFSANGNLFAATRTDADGKYLFTEIPVGQDWTVKFTAPDGMVASPTGQGTDTTTSVGQSKTTTLTTSEPNDLKIDSGFYTPSPKIAITKSDIAGNAADSASGAVVLPNGATGLVLTVTNTGNEPLSNLEVSDRVVANGVVTGLDCTFPNDSTGVSWAGPFEVKTSFECRANLAQMSGSALHHDEATVTAVGTVSGDSATDSNGYFAKIPRVSVGDYVWFDANRDGLQSSGEKGIAAVRVSLQGPDGKSVTDIDGNTVNDVLTGADGSYSFGNLPVLTTGQHYTVTVSTPAGYAATSPAVGSDRAKDSSTGSAQSTVLAADGDTDTTLDFGFVKASPEITVTKGDAEGRAADTSSDAAKLTDGSATLRITVRNTGNEPLKNVKVSDEVAYGGTVSKLSCDFSSLGGPPSGLSWQGPLAVGDSFECTGSLTGVTSSGHKDVVTVTGVGVGSGDAVSDSNPYYATSEGGGLAYTGVDTVTLAGSSVGAVVLMFGGIGAVAVSRRRRPKRAA